MIKADTNKNFIYPLFPNKIGLVIKVYKNNDNLDVIRVFVDNNFYNYKYIFLCNHYTII